MGEEPCGIGQVGRTRAYGNHEVIGMGCTMGGEYTAVGKVDIVVEEEEDLVASRAGAVVPRHACPAAVRMRAAGRIEHLDGDGPSEAPGFDSRP